MTSTSDVTGIVLAGGKGSRIGRNKALIRLGGELLIERTLARLGSVTENVLVVVSGPSDAERLRFLEQQGVELTMDVLPCGGPLAGIHAGLVAARTEKSIVIGCDMPFLEGCLLAYLAEISRDADAVVPRIASRGFVEPLCAAYSKGCIGVIERLASSGCARIAPLFDEVRVKYVDEELWRKLDPEGLSFFNVNTPSDLARASKIIGGLPDGRSARGNIGMPFDKIRTGRANGGD
ncbi:MAG: molybdenum cofactor guanylyltransferase [Bacillota bacterium]